MATIGRKLSTIVREHTNPKEGIAKATAVFKEALDTKKVTWDTISIREMAQSFLGDNWYGALRGHSQQLRESVSAVDASGFSAITGQLFVDTVKERYQSATRVTDQMFRTFNTLANLDTQKVPYLSDVAQLADTVNQGQPYPRSEFKAQYVTLAAPTKKGHISGATLEMVMSDLTGQVREAVESVGDVVAQQVEIERLKVAFGLTNNYVFNGTSLNTYLTSGGWVNDTSTLTLTSWRSLNTLQQLLYNMTDPVTARPIMVDAKQVAVLPFQELTLLNILNATQVRAGDITTGTGDQVVANNPISSRYTPIVPRFARYSISGTSPFTTGAIADSCVLMGDFQKAFYWREAFPLTVVQAPPQNPAEFNQDIVIQVKASVFGVAGVYDPRYVARGYNSSAT